MAYPVRVTSLGVRMKHEPGFLIDRPRGLGEWLFLCYRCPVSARTADGVADGETGDCILYQPDFPQWYHGRGIGLFNDWMHLSGPGVRALAERYELPCNRLMRPRAVGFIPDLFEMIDHELRWQGPFWEDVVRLRVEELFADVARALRVDESQALSPADLTHVDTFRRIRTTVHERLTEHWSVDSMAALAHLSTTRFAVLYKRFFGVSPMEDLLQARLAKAKMLLLNSSVMVSAAAAQSGFDNPCYFSRLFRRRFGCAPREYYHSTVGAEAE